MSGEAAEAEAARPLPRQRKRLRGWLIAAGLSDAPAAGRLATSLLQSDDSPGVAGWIERLDGWLRTEAVLRNPGPALQRLAAEADPIGVLRAAGEERPREAEADDRVPFLPPTLPREMNRQPLGRLPAVLRGGAWVLTTRWSLPNRIGPRISRSLWSWRSPEPAAPPAEEPARP